MIFTPILDNTNIEANASYKQDINELAEMIKEFIETANSDEEARELLTLFNMPFAK